MIAGSQGFAGYLRRDLLLAYRRRGEVASPLIFFVLVSTLIPLGISPDSARLAELAPGIIWVMANYWTNTDSCFFPLTRKSISFSSWRSSSVLRYYTTSVFNYTIRN